MSNSQQVRLMAWARHRYRMSAMKAADPRRFARLKEIEAAIAGQVDDQHGRRLKLREEDAAVELEAGDGNWILVGEWLTHPLTPFFGRWLFWLLWVLSANLRAYWAGREQGMYYRRTRNCKKRERLGEGYIYRTGANYLNMERQWDAPVLASAAWVHREISPREWQGWPCAPRERHLASYDGDGTYLVGNKGWEPLGQGETVMSQATGRRQRPG